MKHMIPSTQISKASLLFAIGMLSLNTAHAQTAPATEDAEEIVVTGMRAALDKAIDIKQSNDHVMEALSMDDINATPAVTIAEALIRLPGVNGSRDRGNESQASIRGLGPRMVFGTVDGREVASPEPGRAIRYEQYPSELISGVEVYKTQSADLIEGGIAGSINLKTLSPLSYNGPEATVRAGAEYNDSGNDIPNYSPYGDRFSFSVVEKLSDEFAFALGGSKQKQKNAYGSMQGWGFNDGTGGQPNMTANGGNLDGKGTYGYAPWGMAYEIKKLDTNRDGGFASLEWKPSDDLDIKYDILYTSVDFKEGQDQTWFGGNNFGDWNDSRSGDYSNITLVNQQAVAATVGNWNAEVNHVIANYSQVNTGLTQGLKFNYTGAENWEISGDLASSRAHRDNYWNAIYLYQYPEAVSYDMRGRPSMSAPAGSILLTPEKADYSGWPNSNWNEGSTLDDNLLSAQLDFKRAIDAGDFKSIDFGVRASSREKEVIWTNFTYATHLATVNLPTGLLSSYTIGAFNSTPILTADYSALKQALYGTASPATNIDQSKYWKVDEDDAAAYIKFDFEGQLGGLDYNANIGVRQVQIKTESFQYDDPTDPNDGGSRSTDFNKTLPSASLNISLNEASKLRFGLARAISRPPLDELRSGQYISATGESGAGGSAGNPYLQPFTSDQADVSYEWYFAKESLAAVSLFYKDIKDYIGYKSFGAVTTSSSTASIYGPTNGQGGYVRGAEFTFQMPFNFLPVEGFGIYSNYSYAQSNIHEFAPENNPLPMTGLAKDTATLDLWYSNHGLDARLGWKYHSAYTSVFGWDSSKLTTLDSELSLGFSLSYDITDHWNVRFQGYNLTNEPSRIYQNNQAANLNRFDDYGRAYLVDFTWKL